MKPTFTLQKFLIGSALLVAVTTTSQAADVTLDGTSGSNSISTAYSTDGGLTLNLGFFAEYLIVGGGGGGGSGASGYAGGGGGGGGFVTGTVVMASAGIKNVVVGAGGSQNNNGQDSSFTPNSIALTALGGGRGGSQVVSAVGGDGGSGGGAGMGTSAGVALQGATGAGYGYNGGISWNNGSVGGGGGGAGAVGATGNVGGHGGAGRISALTGAYYAGGGGGGHANTSIALGGQGGGGDGGVGGGNGVAGTPNTGGGGGAGGRPGNGGAGGSGIVIVRYDGPQAGTGGTITSVSGDTVHQFTGTGSSALDLSGLDLNARLGVTLTSQITGSGGLTYNGPGRLTLSGENLYTGATNITGGTLAVSGTGHINNSTSITVNSGATFRYNSSTALTVATTNNGGTIAGSGNLGTLTLGGTGSVDPGNSPGILTAAATDPSGTLGYNFEMTARNTAPTWSDASASVNDVLRLTGATPFAANMTAANVISVYFGSVATPTAGDVFTGGFFTDTDADFLSAISSATFQYFVYNGVSGTLYNGVFYDVYSGPSITVGTVSVASADFSGGTVDGYVTQFTVAIPEPSAALLGGLGMLALLRRRRN